MVHALVKQVLSPVLDPIGNRVLMSPLGDLGMAYRHGSRSRKAVALTFDDGPVHGGTEQVLDVLDECGVRGTFFCIGANAALNPDVLKRADAAGHVIGAHSMDHGRSGALSLTDGAHIDGCLREIRAVIDKTPALYRPPWGWTTPWEAARLRRRGLHIIQFDLETPDSAVPCPPGSEMHAWTLPRVRPGNIIVFHDGKTHAEHHDKPETARALRLLIEALRQQDYEFVTIPDMLSIPAYQETTGTNQAYNALAVTAAAPAYEATRTTVGEGQ